jgi:hypothetical protein
MHIINKPWGIELVILKIKLFQIKILFIAPNEITSVQVHQYKKELMVYLSKFKIKYIPPNRIHFSKEGIILEFSYGSDSDIIRIKDKYGRKM